MTVTFATIELKNPSPFRPRLQHDQGIEVTFSCFTDTYSDITDLEDECGVANKYVCYPSGKILIQTTGTKGTLDMGGGLQYTNCVIMGPIQVQEIPAGWIYQVTFAQDTAS